MKKQYAAPCVTVYGNVEAITNAIGRDPATDAVIFNGKPLGIDTDGSTDLVLP